MPEHVHLHLSTVLNNDDPDVQAAGLRARSLITARLDADRIRDFALVDRLISEVIDDAFAAITLQSSEAEQLPACVRAIAVQLWTLTTLSLRLATAAERQAQAVALKAIELMEQGRDAEVVRAFVADAMSSEAVLQAAFLLADKLGPAL